MEPQSGHDGDILTEIRAALKPNAGGNIFDTLEGSEFKNFLDQATTIHAPAEPPLGSGSKGIQLLTDPSALTPSLDQTKIPLTPLVADATKTAEQLAIAVVSEPSASTLEKIQPPNQTISPSINAGMSGFEKSGRGVGRGPSEVQSPTLNLDNSRAPATPKAVEQDTFVQTAKHSPSFGGHSKTVTVPTFGSISPSALSFQYNASEFHGAGPILQSPTGIAPSLVPSTAFSVASMQTTSGVQVATPTQQIAAAVVHAPADKTIEVRLDPPSLGKVSIEFDFQPDAPIRAVVSAENSDTLSLLRRQAADLMKELTAAGFEDVSLDFDDEQTFSWDNSEDAERAKHFAFSAKDEDVRTQETSSLLTSVDGEHLDIRL